MTINTGTKGITIAIVASVLFRRNVFIAVVMAGSSATAIRTRTNSPERLDPIFLAIVENIS